MSLEPGHQLQQGRYTIKERLNQGGMGTIYLAEDRNLTGREVAIKENLDTAATTQQQFQHEAIMLSRLTHPNLPRVTDHFVEESGAQYLVMDFVPGDDLHALLRSGSDPFPEQQVLEWLDQVMDALSYMHSWIDPITRKPTPIIHRDIKPGNIKLTPNGRVVLVDFGIAKYEEPAEGTMLGAKGRTPGYSPLEQYTGRTTVRSDIYALGATYYALLTHQRPPDSTAIAAGTPLRPLRYYNAQISRTTERVVMRAMALQAAQRYASVAEMRSALLQKDDTERDPAPPAVATNPYLVLEETKPLPSRPGRWRMIGGISILAILALLILFIILLPNSWIAAPPLVNSTPPNNTPSPDPPDDSGAASLAVLITATLSVATPTLGPTDSELSTDFGITVTTSRSLTVVQEDVQGDLPSLIAADIEADPAGATPTDSATATPLAVDTATTAPMPTDTPTSAPTFTSPSPPTALPTSTATAAPTFTPTATATATSTATATASPTDKPTATASPTAKSTATIAATATAASSGGAPPTVAEAGALWNNERDGAAYRFVPAGVFAMGSEVEPDESPIHDVNLDAFWVMETEVTNAFYAECVAADACTPPSTDAWKDPALANHPVANITWAQAVAYAEWSGGRLPTEAEWEKAARGTDQRDFPWPNNEPGDHGININTATTVDVGTFPESASPFGALDMAGNVEEWVADWYSPTYYAESPAENPTGPASGIFRVVRGGSFRSNQVATRTTKRDGAIPNSTYESVGFRVVIPVAAE